MLYPITPIFLSSVLHAPVEAIGFIEGVAEAVASILRSAFGQISDRTGRRRPFVLGGYTISALAKPIIALAHTWPIVLVARVGDRLGKGMRTAPRAEIAKYEINKISGITTSVAVIIIIIVALAGLGLVVVNSLSESSWGTFTIAATIPIALIMGVWMSKIRKGKMAEATIFGVIMLVLAVIYGRYIPNSPIASWFTYNHHSLTILLALYGFLASVLPVWLLLSPRDYLSSIMKITVVAMLAIGIIVVAPNLKMPAFTPFIHGGGPIIPGTLFPYLFITIACGAISGFHSLVSSGTTPKMLMNEKHIKTIAVGSMLIEGLVSILALVAAASLHCMARTRLSRRPPRRHTHGKPVAPAPGRPPLPAPPNATHSRSPLYPR